MSISMHVVTICDRCGASSLTRTMKDWAVETQGWYVLPNGSHNCPACVEATSPEGERLYGLHRYM